MPSLKAYLNADAAFNHGGDGCDSASAFSAMPPSVSFGRASSRCADDFLGISTSQHMPTSRPRRATAFAASDAARQFSSFFPTEKGSAMPDGALASGDSSSSSSLPLSSSSKAAFWLPAHKHANVQLETAFSESQGPIEWCKENPLICLSVGSVGVSVAGAAIRYTCVAAGSAMVLYNLGMMGGSLQETVSSTVGGGSSSTDAHRKEDKKKKKEAEEEEEGLLGTVVGIFGGSSSSAAEASGEAASSSNEPAKAEEHDGTDEEDQDEDANCEQQ